MPEDLVSGEAAEKEALRVHGEKLHKRLKELFINPKKRKQFSLENAESKADVEGMLARGIMAEVFDGKTVDQLPENERFKAQFLDGKIELFNEPKDIVIKYYVDKHFVPYFDSIQIKEGGTIYA